VNQALATTFQDLTRALKPGNDWRPITSKYQAGKTTLHIVSDNGRFYLADDFDIRSLRQGFTPDELQLSPCSDSFPDED
jgi:hypothetical protein